MNPRAATPGPRLRPRLDPATLEPSILEPSTSRSLLLFVDLAVDEYDDEDISSDLSDDGAEPSDDEAEMSVESEVRAGGRAVLEKLKVQRVEKLCSEVREFGAELIDVDELASIYDFRIDKFQRLAIEAFLRGSSVVVSAPTSSGKTLIAEAAAVATVARGRRLFYTTPLKALSNQKFRELRWAIVCLN
ncbi:hypothetical protein CDL15_Pgr016047 [Punica granatum]|uniref:Helicase ATP-binding domain-containing protein n=1 Tax=Punica granatum TaxID=22663 RepID=A0A218XQ99_PUNGR|nr:hypothetical protein CDL15_Pgr016047 [Punica granatum]